MVLNYYWPPTLKAKRPPPRVVPAALSGCVPGHGVQMPSRSSLAGPGWGEVCILIGPQVYSLGGLVKSCPVIELAVWVISAKRQSGELRVSAAATVGTCRVCFRSPETEAKGRKHIPEGRSGAVCGEGASVMQVFQFWAFQGLAVLWLYSRVALNLHSELYPLLHPPPQHTLELVEWAQLPVIICSPSNRATRVCWRWL